MNHHRSPTHSYTQNMPHLSVHATLALRHAHPAIPTLLSPLRSPPSGPGDALDDFQSNAWVNAPPYRTSLAGLGIICLRDPANLHGPSLAPEDSVLQMQIDGDDELLLWPDETLGTDIPPDDFGASTVLHRGLDAEGNRRIAHCFPNFVAPPGDESTSCTDSGLDGDVGVTANTIGLIPDVNMYDRIRPPDLPHPGVNPLDTIRNSSLHDMGTLYGERAPSIAKDHPNDDILPTTDSRPEQSLSPRVIQDIMSILVQPAPEFSFPPRFSATSPSQRAAPQRSSVGMKPKATNIPDSEHHVSPIPCDLAYPNTTHSSPILNAHLGIELNELISRAERFRIKYPEREIDRAWLSHFAGKLSDRGELLNDFRCYVIGCDQRNKRRDHILVHVGAHIGQRPFACSVCPLRFLRKNECKRHEASHSGFRPYSCDICGQSFVRQDLVKRHVKRTHGKDENEPGIVKQSRKRARLR